jgi:uncharacterized repeat protein (TIGR03806 family)
MVPKLRLISGCNLSTLAVALLGTALFCLAAQPSQPYGIAKRTSSKPFLSMPERADGVIPPLLSQTGAFTDTPNLVPAPGLIPYDLVVPFWSDGAGKERWMAAPDGGKIKFSATGEWGFPKGTVFVKHFELPIDERTPQVQRRLETRLLVCDSAGGVYGVSYKWRADNSDAELLTSNLFEKIAIQTASGTRAQTWYYPSRQDCLTCHTKGAGGVLGPKARQLNHPFTYPSGVTDSELRAWNHAGLFEPDLDERNLGTIPTLARLDDTTRPLEERARSYLDANCSSCHRPGGTVANFDARYDVPLAKQRLIEGEVLINEGLDHAHPVAPRDIWRSIVFLRINTLEGMKMPPLAHQELDHTGIGLMRQWIESLPGKPVLPPPIISQHGGNYAQPVEVALAESEPGSRIHYTLDGSAPDKEDPVYERPIRLTTPTVLRARAFKDGFTRSITSQEVFVIGE